MIVYYGLSCQLMWDYENVILCFVPMKYRIFIYVSFFYKGFDFFIRA